MRIPILIALVAWLGTGCAANKPVADEGARRVLGFYTARVLERPTRIEGWNFAAPHGVSYSDPMIRSLDLSVAEELRNILFDDKTFARPGKGMFRRSVGFRVWRDQDSVDVLISLQSDDILIKTRGDTGQETSISAGATNAHDRLINLAKRAFADYEAGR